MPHNKANKQLSLRDQFNQAGASAALAFDLDNTIVDISSLYTQMEANYTDFLAKKLNISKQAAHLELQDMLKQGYYVQDEALKRHGIAVGETLVVTYDPNALDLKKLQVNPGLKNVLDSISCEKYILTNATSYYAEAVLHHLGLRDCFDGVAGVDTLNYRRKPHGACYNAFESLFGLQGKEIHLFEDTPENIDAAYFLNGWHGHLVEGYRPTPAYGNRARHPHYLRSLMHSLMDLKS